MNFSGINSLCISKAKDLNRKEFMKYSHTPFHLPSYTMQPVLRETVSVAVRPSGLVLLCQKYDVHWTLASIILSDVWSRPLDDRTETDVNEVLTGTIVDAEDGKCLHDVCNTTSFCTRPVVFL
jgi:hypothetical protein